MSLENDQWEGPGIFTKSDGTREIGEWQNGLLHGCGKEDCSSKYDVIYWGEFRQNKKEGFGTI
jgi:hypothetical protein